MKEREKIKQRNRSYSVTATDKTMTHLNTFLNCNINHLPLQDYGITQMYS